MKKLFAIIAVCLVFASCGIQTRKEVGAEVLYEHQLNVYRAQRDAYDELFARAKKKHDEAIAAGAPELARVYLEEDLNIRPRNINNARRHNFKTVSTNKG